MPLSYQSRKGQWFLISAMLVISTTLSIGLAVYRLHNTRLSTDWNDPGLMFFITTVNSLKNMPAVSGELRQYYYSYYEDYAKRHGIYLNITDESGRRRIVMISPTLRVNRLI